MKQTQPQTPTVPAPTVTRPSARGAPPPTLQEWVVQQPRPLPARSGKPRFALMLLLPGLLVTAALVFALIAGALLYRSSLIMPGVRVMGLDLSGKSTAEAMTLLQERWQAQRIDLVDTNGALYPVAPEKLGISLNAAATVQLAHRQGRSIPSLAAALKSEEALELPPVWSVNISAAESALRSLASQFEIAPVNAEVRLGAGRAEAAPASPGRRLDLSATLAQLEQTPQQILDQGRLYLVMAPVAPAITDVSAIVTQANELLARPPSFRAYDPISDEAYTWTMPLQEWSAALDIPLNVESSANGDWTLDEAPIRAFLAHQVAGLGSDRYLKVDEVVEQVKQTVQVQNEAIRLRIFHQERRHTVQAGETLSSIAYDYGIPYPWIQQANPGVGDSLSPGQELTIPSPDLLLPLPVVENKRIVVSLGQQKMWAYEDGAVKWEWSVSTGIPSSPTAPGVFQIQSHEVNAFAASWNLWMPHFMGIYRPVPTSHFMNGFHGFPTRSGSTLLWTDDLGHPVTYGCILVSSDNAVLLYDWAEEGVVVEIQK